MVRSGHVEKEKVADCTDSSALVSVNHYQDKKVAD